jgi:hypothetical protein
MFEYYSEGRILEKKFENLSKNKIKLKTFEKKIFAQKLLN